MAVSYDVNELVGALKGRPTKQEAAEWNEAMSSTLQTHPSGNEAYGDFEYF